MDLSKLYNCICATRMRHPTSIIDYMDLSKIYNCICATRMHHPTSIIDYMDLSKLYNPVLKRVQPVSDLDKERP
jgi:hypothetical protein